MDNLTPAIPAGHQFIEAYGGGGFRVSGRKWDGSVLIVPEQTVAWPVAKMDDVRIENLQPILDTEPAIEVLLLGCGVEMAAIDDALRQKVREGGAVVELMDTGAACRTFNVLAGESRRIAAALIAVE